MGRWVACTLLLAACSFKSAAAPDDGRIIDSPRDSPGDVAKDGIPDAQQCFGTGLGVHICLQSLPTDPFDVTADTSIQDTASDALCDQTIADYCVIAATKITIHSSRDLTATGMRPLVLIATATLEVDGTIDASSHIHVGRNGPGAQLGCTDGTAPPNDGGGYGGTLGTLGGTGGNGGGAPSAVVAVSTLRGGCSGSDGSPVGAGPGGAGGGIVYMIAGTSIDIKGTVDASGAAGSAGTPAIGAQRGGGGGGSGGLIVFDSPIVLFDMNARIFANGGGGGEASDQMKGGHDGHDATAPGAGGVGGSAGSNGGNGGDGGDDVNAGSDGDDGTFGGPGGQGGGGGGGGGVGVIRVLQSGIPPMGSVSPPAN